MSVTIYGSSDDLIEVEGDITEEFSYPLSAEEGNGALLVFSEGTVLRVRYDDNGVWRINVVTTGTNFVGHVQAPEDDEDNYSDRVTLSGPSPLRWVVLGTEIAMAKAVGRVSAR